MAEEGPNEEMTVVKRWMTMALVAVMLASMGGAALADEGDPGDEDKSVLEASDVQVLRAMRLAEFFEEDPDVLGDLRTGDDEESAIGWGALYKLLLLADYYEMDLASYLDGGDFEEGWGFGKLFKELKDTDPEWLGDNPRNFGQWKKHQRETDGWQPPGLAKKNG